MKRLLNLFLLAALPAMAQVTVSEAWVRGTVAQQKATGAFMTIQATQDSRLVGASSPAAGTVEVHEMSMSNDVMRMRQLESLELPAGKPVKLMPGGYHLMLMQLQRPLAEGDKVPLTLDVEDAKHVRSKVTVEAVVRPLAASHQH